MKRHGSFRPTRLAILTASLDFGIFEIDAQ
jgi:hypothetical protein